MEDIWSTTRSIIPMFLDLWKGQDLLEYQITRPPHQLLHQTQDILEHVSSLDTCVTRVDHSGAVPRVLSFSTVYSYLSVHPLLD